MIQFYKKIRDGKRTHILYSSKSASTCEKNNFGKSKSTYSNNYLSKKKKVQALKYTCRVKVKSTFNKANFDLTS